MKSILALRAKNVKIATGMFNGRVGGAGGTGSSDNVTISSPLNFGWLNHDKHICGKEKELSYHPYRNNIFMFIIVLVL